MIDYAKVSGMERRSKATSKDPLLGSWSLSWSSLFRDTSPKRAAFRVATCNGDVKSTIGQPSCVWLHSWFGNPALVKSATYLLPDFKLESQEYIQQSVDIDIASSSLSCCDLPSIAFPRYRPAAGQFARSIVFDAATLQRLATSDAFLNDDAINGCSAIFRTTASNFTLFSTYDLAVLHHGGDCDSMEKIWRYTKHLTYWEHGYWLIPIHQKDQFHWTVACVDFHTCTIDLFDSLADEDESRNDIKDVTAFLRLTFAAARKAGKSCQFELQLSKLWNGRILNQHPLQYNGYDCGVWVLAQIHALLSGYCCTVTALVSIQHHILSLAEPSHRDRSRIHSPNLSKPPSATLIPSKADCRAAVAALRFGSSDLVNPDSSFRNPLARIVILLAYVVRFAVEQLKSDVHQQTSIVNQDTVCTKCREQSGSTYKVIWHLSTGSSRGVTRYATSSPVKIFIRVEKSSLHEVRNELHLTTYLSVFRYFCFVLDRKWKLAIVVNSAGSKIRMDEVHIRSRGIFANWRDVCLDCKMGYRIKMKFWELGSSPSHLLADSAPSQMHIQISVAPSVLSSFSFRKHATVSACCTEMYLRGRGAPPNRRGMFPHTGWQAAYNPRSMPPPLPTQSQLSSDLDSNFDSGGEDELQSSQPMEGDDKKEVAFTREEQAELDNDPEAGLSEDWHDGPRLTTEVLSQPPITAMHWNMRQEDQRQEMIPVSQGIGPEKLQASPSPKRPVMLAPSEVFKSTLGHFSDSDSGDEDDVSQPPSPSPLPQQQRGLPIQSHSAVQAVPVSKDYPLRSHSTLPSSEVHATKPTIPHGRYRNLPSWANPIPPEDSSTSPSTIQPASLHLPTHRPPSSHPSSAHIPTGHLPFGAQPPSANPSLVYPPSAHPSLARPSSESAHPPSARTSSAHPFSVRPPSARPPSTRPPSAHPPSAQPPFTHPSERSAHLPLTHPPEQPSTMHPSIELPPAAHLPSAQEFKNYYGAAPSMILSASAPSNTVLEPSNAAPSTWAPAASPPPAFMHTSAPLSTELDDLLEDNETSGNEQNTVPASRKGRIPREALEKVDQASQDATKILQDVRTTCDISFDTIIKHAFPQLEHRRLNQFNGFQKMYRATHEGRYDINDVCREYNLTKEKLLEDDFQDLLSVSNSLQTLDNETMTWGTRKAAFRKEQSQLTKALQNLSERFAFESALIMVGSHLEDGPTMGQLFETRRASNFFEEKFRCTPKLLINHLQAHSRYGLPQLMTREDLYTGDNVLQDTTKQDIERGTHSNLQQEATKQNPPPAESVNVTVPVLGHYNVAIRTKPHFESGHPSSTMFPWSKLPSALHEAVTNNNDTATPYLSKGFSGYSEAQQLSMAKTLEIQYSKVTSLKKEIFGPAVRRACPNWVIPTFVPDHEAVRSKPTKEKSQKRKKRATRGNPESDHEEPSAKKVKVTAQERGASMQAGPSHVPSNQFFAPLENHTAPSNGFRAALHLEFGDDRSTMHFIGQCMNEVGYDNGEAARSSENAPPRTINIGGQIYQLRS
ncbi:hypothetical protein BDZ89DRAFT_1046059 [Hymenopellis radicata]|nr:hypothetical protein BDZ89DRAFT_1046059 [Hymenopellis radicata]